ncbi:MAG: hypothetical protein FWF29_00480, partial [Treponema sp.]|nr:hypothetical protein [Treponema sp.]
MLMKQNQLRLWTVIAVLAAALLFGACSQPTDELGSAVTLTAGSAQNVDYTDTSTAISFTGSNIPDLTAADFSIAPAGNGVEIADVTVNAEKTSVSVGAIFPANSAVSAVVYTITVAPGNKKVKASSGVAITQAGGPAVVSDLDLSGLFAAPVASAAPDTAFDSTQYSGSIAWETAAGDPAGSKFDYSTGYKAVIILSTNPGYILDGLSNGTGVFSYTGAVSVNYDNTFGKVTIGFAATSDPHVISGSLFGS